MLRPGRQRTLVLALAALVGACGSPGSTAGSEAVPPERYPPATPDGARERAVLDAILSDFEEREGTAGYDPAVLDAQAQRWATIIAWQDAGELESAAQRFWAGAALVRSDEPMHLVLAESLGASAAILGEPRGRLVQAEARDRMAMIIGEPQPFGTQSVFVPITGRWRLYTVDARTTDEERRAMGLPTLAELEARAEARNDTAATERLRRDFLRSP